MLIALTSFSGAPGVTTAAVAWATEAARATILVEASVDGGSPILASAWEGTMRHERSIMGLATLDPSDRMEGLLDHAITLRDKTDAWLIPGIGQPIQARSLAPLWGDLGDFFQSLSKRAMDVVVDLGRWGSTYGPTPIAEAADLVLAITDTTIPALNTTVINAHALREASPALADRVAVVPVVGERAGRSRLMGGSGPTLRPYGAGEVRALLAGQVHVFNGLRYDPAGAAPYTSNQPRRKRQDATPYTRALKTLMTDVSARVADLPTRSEASL